MSKKAAIVCTTINDGTILDAYYKNLEKFGHLGNTQAFIVPDKKTPEKIFDKSAEQRKKGFDCICPTLDEQNNFLKKININPEWIKLNSDHRRNIGYLMALDSNADFVISIDDDNFCAPNVDCFAEHAIVASDTATKEVISTSNQWINICESLHFGGKGTVYARGYPYYQRHQTATRQSDKVKTTIRLNAGLWLKDPDVDGISWLVNPQKSNSWDEKSIVLAPRTWTPVNTQNTGLHRDVVPSYYFIRMGYPVGGTKIDRYGDIFSGYFSLACAYHLNHSLRVGSPVADHIRNAHDYMKDATNEWACIQVLEELLPWLTKECQLEGNDYASSYLSLADGIQSFAKKNETWSAEVKGFFVEMVDDMKIWIKACQTIGVQISDQ